MKFKKYGLLSGIILTVFLLSIAGCATQPQSTQPENIQGQDDSWKFHDIVDVDFVKQHVSIPMAENVMLIDARPKRAKYDKGHIPMAVSIPYLQFDEMTAKLPRDKNALLIYYCGGLKCKLSHKSAWKAEKLGYTNVKVFAEGFPGWMKVKGHYATVSVEWVKWQIDNGTDMVLVDSRPKRNKYDRGHIPTAISMPTTHFDKMVDQLPQQKDKLLVFYCGGFKCKLSHKGARKAISLGYANVKVFAAGYPAWKAYAGTDNIAKPAVANIKSGKEEGSIDHDVFTQIVNDSPESVYLIDVRDPDEFATGSFETAQNIPIEKLEAKISSLPSDKPIVFVCGTGARSGEAYYMVQDLRPELKEVYYVEAEISISKDGSFKLTEIVY